MEEDEIPELIQKIRSIIKNSSATNKELCAFKLREIWDWEYSRIADAMNISAGSARNFVIRCKQKITEELS